MNINMAEATVRLLFEKGLVEDVGDLYGLKEDEIIGLERFARKSSKNLIKSIENSKNLPWHRLLYGLGIRFVGETVARKLATAFPSVDRLIEAGMKDLLEVDEVGDKIAQSVTDYFSRDRNIRIINKLKEAGVNMQQTELDADSGEGKLGGLKFVISGTFERYSREELKTLIEQNGGANVSAVSSNVDYLIGGSGIGPSKMQKAKDLSVPVISEQEFISMINSEA
jgi:DNA ligase (NAD+)